MVFPVRTCIGCGTRASKAELVRLVVLESSHPQVVVDDGGSRPGRGAYLHRDLGCLQRAVRRRSFNRALRSAAVVDASALAVTLG